MEQIEQANRAESFDDLKDVRGRDLSDKDLSRLPTDVLINADFDTKTVWPSKEHLPAGFNPEKVLENAKDPGLGIRALHKRGVDGRGVKVAIIDQTLSSEEGKLMPHSEYVKNIIDYKEFGNARSGCVSMHGPAVGSLLVGKECGIAPGAEVVYRAIPSGRDFNFQADALLDIVKFNKTLPHNQKIKIVSCSIGYMEEKSELGLDRWISAIKMAEESGIIVSDVGDRTGVDMFGGGSVKDKSNPDEYDKALFSKNHDYSEIDNIFTESNGNIDIVVEKIRGLGKKEILDMPESALRSRVEDALKNRANQIIIPCDYRTMASYEGPNEYMYNGEGGMSWSVPYLTGLFTLAFQINPNLTKEEIADAINKTASVNKKGLKIINPVKFIEFIQG